MRNIINRTAQRLAVVLKRVVRWLAWYISGLPVLKLIGVRVQTVWPAFVKCPPTRCGYNVWSKRCFRIEKPSNEKAEL